MSFWAFLRFDQRDRNSFEQVSTRSLLFPVDLCYLGFVTLDFTINLALDVSWVTDLKTLFGDCAFVLRSEKAWIGR